MNSAPSGRTDGMSHAIRALAALITFALLTGTAAAAEPVAAGADFRADADFDQLSRRGPAVSGWLYNDRGYGVSNVRLRVEVMDATGGALGTSEGWLYGNVPARGRGYFFVIVPRRGESYRITVLSFDRLEMGGS
jgi:hypothetical protein